MNVAQLHLMFNHLPSIGQVIGIAVFVFGFFSSSEIVKKTGAWVILISAIFVWPVSWSGEQTEELIENQQGISESLMHEHEESAETAFKLTLLSAAVALAYLAAAKWKPDFSKPISFAVIAIGSASIAFLVIASHKGGLIKHPELIDGSTANTEINNRHEEQEED